jgi:hypothetical protein
MTPDSSGESGSGIERQFEVDAYGDEPQIWIRGDGTIHIGDEELSWRLTPKQAQQWAKVLWKLGEEAEEVYR